MECACVSVDVDDYECCSELISDKWHKARKDHRCCECHRTIVNGEQYRRETLSDDGKISTYKTCADCESLKGAFFCGGYLFGNVWGDFQESFSDCFEDLPWSKLPDLTPAARNRVFEMIEECWDDDDDDDM